MKVSYITTVYNKATYLPFVIDGLAKQEGDFDREFIFVDDGSTDDSVSILHSLVDILPGHVELIQQKNQGPAIASNNGLEKSTGDFIKFVDGDDVLLPWATDILLKLIKSGRHAYAFSTKPAPISYENLCPEGLKGFIAGLRSQCADVISSEWANPLEYVIQHSRGNPTSWIATSDTVARIGGCAKHIFVQDYIMELSLAAQGSAGVWPGPTFLYPMEDETRVSAHKAQILHDLNKALAEAFRRNPEKMSKYGLQAAKRATGRAWHFARREKGVSSALLIKSLIWFTGVRVGLIKFSPKLFEATTEIFQNQTDIR